MSDFSKGKVYRIVCNITGKQYVGSTIQSLSKRKESHKRNHIRWVNEGRPEKRLQYTSVYVLDGGNYSIVLIENYPCNSKDELKARERHYIETLDCVNKQTPTRTRDEYRMEERDRINEGKRNHYHQNKEEISKRVAEKYANDPEVQEKAKSRSKAAHERLRSTEEGRAILKERAKQYYQRNKEKILAKQHEKYHNDEEFRKIHLERCAKSKSDQVSEES